MPEEIQLRTCDGDTRFVDSVTEAFEAARTSRDVSKISWSEGENRIRLVCGGHVNDQPCWIYSPLMEEIEEQFGSLHPAVLRVLRNSAPDSRSGDSANDSESDRTEESS